MDKLWIKIAISTAILMVAFGVMVVLIAFALTIHP